MTKNNKMFGALAFAVALLSAALYVRNQRPRTVARAVTPNTYSAIRTESAADPCTPGSLDCDTPSEPVVEESGKIARAFNSMFLPSLPPPAMIPSADPDFTDAFTNEYDAEIIKSAAKHKIAPSVIKQLLIAESSLNPNAVGSIGEKGLAQFTDATWNDIAPGKDPFNPVHAIDAAGKYLRWLTNYIEKKTGVAGNLGGALESYNGGIGNYLKNNSSDAAKAYRAKIEARSGFLNDDTHMDAAA